MPDKVDRDVIPVIEERASVTKRQIMTGRVQIATETEIVEQHLPADLTSVEVEVTRVPANRRIDVVPDVITQGGLTIIPVIEERLVVTRELYLREEVHVRRIERQDSVQIPAQIRRQTVRIDRTAGGPETQSSSKDHDDDL